MKRGSDFFETSGIRKNEGVYKAAIVNAVPAALLALPRYGAIFRSAPINGQKALTTVAGVAVAFILLLIAVWRFEINELTAS